MRAVFCLLPARHVISQLEVSQEPFGHVYDSVDLRHHDGFRCRRRKSRLPVPRGQRKIRRDRLLRNHHHVDAARADGRHELDLQDRKVV